ncbi:MAG: hypothetical protein EBV35_08335, partial [Betaproteobacteria bacterium]|nr:hypothetical protein [Betaproteobacteria bacterium]
REGIELEHIDLGGGVGIVYRDETPIDLAAYCGALTRKFAGRSETLMVEPGRSLVGNAGVLLTRVEYLKPGEGKNFAVVDAAMNDLMRPALYEAWHAVEPVAPRDAGSLDWDIVGPVCESGDFLARGRHLALAEGDLLAILSAGAYGMRRIDIRVDAERDRRRRTVRLGHLVDARQLGCRLNVEALDVGLERLLDLGAGLAHPGEHDLAGVSPGREHACQFSARDDVETRAQFRENAQNSQIAVGFDRVADLMRMPCQRLVVGLKRRH